MRLTTRRRHIIAGLCVLVGVSGATTVGIKWAFGEFDAGYRLQVDFSAAGQGLVEDSDVKMRGLDIGHVEGIELRDGRAVISIFIDDGNEIPRNSSTFTIRPKTLFGEKFIDVVPGPDETEGPYFDDGDEVPRYFADGEPVPEGSLVDVDGRALRSAGGIELERVLSDVYPILQAVDPEELFTILDELSTAGRGMGETINRSIVNGERVLDVQASRDAELRRFIDDLALLTDELADRAPDVIGGAEDLNVALPVLIENEDDLTSLLVALEGTSGQLADLLEANTAFIESVYGDGQAVLDTLYERRSQIVPLVVGLRQYVEAVGGAARIPVGDGTVMAAVKGILGGDGCEFVPCATAPPLPPTTLPPLPLPQSGPSGPASPEALALPPVDVGAVDEALDETLRALDGHARSGTDAVIDILLGRG